MIRKFNVIKGMEACPECGQDYSFEAHAEQVREDLCEVWVTCCCGYDPTADDHSKRAESVMGDLSKLEILSAALLWNDEVRLGR